MLHGCTTPHHSHPLHPQALKAREEAVRNGKLTTIVFIRDRNPKGQEVREGAWGGGGGWGWGVRGWACVAKGRVPGHGIVSVRDRHPKAQDSRCKQTAAEAGLRRWGGGGGTHGTHGTPGRDHISAWGVMKWGGRQR